MGVSRMLVGWVLPSKAFALESPLGVAAAMACIRRSVELQRLLRGPLPLDRLPFEGKVGDEQFAISRVGVFQNRSYVVLRGLVTSRPPGVRVSGRIELTLAAKISSCLLLGVAALICGTLVVEGLARPFTPAAFAPLAVLAFSVVTTRLAFVFEAYFATRRLARILDARRVAVQSRADG